jgi:chromosome segregation ATPase
VDLTKSRYRIRKELEAGSQATVEVTLRRPRLQTIQLITLTRQQLVVFAKNEELDPKLRRAIAKIGDLRQAIDQHQRHLNQLTQSRKQIFEEQKRIRNNLARVPSNSDLFRRYLKKLNVQEDELESFIASMKATQNDLQRAQDDLTKYIAGLEI